MELKQQIPDPISLLFAHEKATLFQPSGLEKLQRVHKSGKKCLSAFSRVIQLLLLTDVHVAGFYFKKKTIKVNELKKNC